MTTDFRHRGTAAAVALAIAILSALALGSTAEARTESGANAANQPMELDTEAPDTIIDGHPLAVGPHDLVDFTFHSTEPGSYFQCRLDYDDWLFCSSPVSMYLYEGTFLFEVRAGDEAGNVDQSPASFSFTIDRSQPETTIDSGPDGTIDTDQATFSFSSVNSGVEFKCKLDDGAEEACSSAKTYTGLSNGQHEFAVYAVNQFGIPDPTPATRTFTVNRPGPDDPEPPSNAFSFGKTSLNRKNGTATVQVKVPGAGKVALTGSRTVASATKSAAAKGTVSLLVRPRGNAARSLRKKGSVKVRARFSFTPAGGTVKTRTMTVKLIRTMPKR